MKLNCPHLFCKNCLKTHWKSEINNKNFNLKCPGYKCLIEIPYNLLQINLPSAYFDKYDTFLCKKSILSIKPTNSDEKSIECPNKSCKLFFIINKESSYFKCPSCLKTFCANESCFGDWELHTLKNCEEYKKEKPTLLKKERCPNCQSDCVYIGPVLGKKEKMIGKYCMCVKCQKIHCNICDEFLKKDQMEEHSSLEGKLRG